MLGALIDLEKKSQIYQNPHLLHQSCSEIVPTRFSKYSSGLLGAAWAILGTSLAESWLIDTSKIDCGRIERFNLQVGRQRRANSNENVEPAVVAIVEYILDGLWIAKQWLGNGMA